MSFICLIAVRLFNLHCQFPAIAQPIEKEDSSGTVLVNVGAISSTISAVVTQAIKTACSPENLASLIDAGNQQEAPGLVDQTVGDEVIAILTINQELMKVHLLI